jgi:hypothetical protein
VKDTFFSSLNQQGKIDKVHQHKRQISAGFFVLFKMPLFSTREIRFLFFLNYCRCTYICLTMSQTSLALGTRNMMSDNTETTMGIEVIQQSSLLLRAGLLLIFVKTLMINRIVKSIVLIVPAIPTPKANLPNALENGKSKD